MATNFIPPIPIGQFRPSSEAIASWLYEVWKYLQEHPIPTAEDISGDAEEVAENYVAANVPPMIASAVSALSYAQFVDGTTLPIYRAANDEIDNPDLIEAWDEGCRFALVDDENVYVMIRDGDTVNLLQILTEQQAEGVVSVNGQSGVVVLKTSDLQNDSGYITRAGAPVQSVNGQTGAVTIPNATPSVNGLMQSADKLALNGLKTNPEIPYGICDTASATAAKTVTVSPAITELVDGQLLFVRFEHTNTAASPTLNVNGLGAKNFGIISWQQAIGTTPLGSWKDGQTILLRYAADHDEWERMTPPQIDIRSYTATDTTNNYGNVNVPTSVVSVTGGAILGVSTNHSTAKAVYFGNEANNTWILRFFNYATTNMNSLASTQVTYTIYYIAY